MKDWLKVSNELILDHKGDPYLCSMNEILSNDDSIDSIEECLLVNALMMCYVTSFYGSVMCNFKKKTTPGTTLI